MTLGDMPVLTSHSAWKFSRDVTAAGDRRCHNADTSHEEEVQ